VVSYGYDAAHRLTSESRTGTNSYSYTYTVDGAGNRTAQVKGGTTTNFTLNTDDELTATSGGFTNSYSYNAADDQTNRTLSGTSYTLAYDYEGQLTSSTVGGVSTTFACDALGRRISRTAGGTTTQFLSSGSQIWLEAQGGTTTATYTYGNALIRKDGETPMFDGLGSERTVTNSSQTVTGTITFEGFGATIATTGSSSNPYKFAATSGYRDDGDAVLVHVGARYYDAQVGRFITRDTELNQHPYLYCEHDPVNSVDPTGHLPAWLEKAIDKVVGFVENGPGGTAGVYLRGISIFGPFYVIGIIAVHKYKRHWKYTNPPGSIGRENGGTRKGQNGMVEKWSDPENHDGEGR
jgi:RHS repeat-associated protein